MDDARMKIQQFFRYQDEKYFRFTTITLQAPSKCVGDRVV